MPSGNTGMGSKTFTTSCPCSLPFRCRGVRKWVPNRGTFMGTITCHHILTKVCSCIWCLKCVTTRVLGYIYGSKIAENRARWFRAAPSGHGITWHDFRRFGTQKWVPLLGLYSCTLVGVDVPSSQRCAGIRSGSTCCVLRLGEFSHRVRDEFESLRLEFSAEQM